MQFRCYTCGFKFSDGPPPLEALSGPQSNALYGVKREAAKLPMPEKFADLTPYNFCAFCLTLVVDFPSTFQDIEGHGIQWESDHYDCEWQVVFCGCGELHQLEIRKDGEPYGGNFNWKANRYNKLHKAQVIYPLGDFSLSIELIDMEI